MYRFLLTPRWWGINLFAVLAIPVCLFMGGWQLDRFEARIDSHEEQQKAAEHSRDAEAEPLSSLLPVDKSTVGRTAEVTGRYDSDRTLLIPERRLDDREGFYVLDLLRPSSGEDAASGEGSGEDAASGEGSGKGAASGEGSGKGAASGEALPVVRGWLPGEADRSRVPPAPRGEVTVQGVVQASESHDSSGVGKTGGLPEGQLGFISAAGLVNVVPYDVHDAWISVQHTGKDSPLKPVPPAAADNTGLDMKAFQNLGYTAEWFVFAGFVLFMWFRLFRRETELARDVELGIVEPTDPAGAEPRPADSATGSPTTGSPTTGSPIAGGVVPEPAAGEDAEARSVTGDPEGAAGRSRSPDAPA